jgi:hypothetical protein
VDIEEYLKMSDNYDNPKTIKMYEKTPVEKVGKRFFRAVTYLRTSLIGYQAEIDETNTDIEKKCKARGHSEGRILEVGRFPT